MKPGLFKSYFGAICVPQIDKADGTISSVTHDWANAAAGLGGGLAVTVLRLNVKNRKVGEAKQAMAEMAVNSGCQWAFFLDDDVLVPPDALMKMIQRWRQDPEKYKIQNGVYWSKSEPPQPLIFDGSFEGSYWDWHVGDLLEMTGAGAGCTFVDTSVFKDMPKPWFSTHYVYNDLREGMDDALWKAEEALLGAVKSGADQKIIKQLESNIAEQHTLMAEMKETKGLDPSQTHNVQPAGSTTEDLYFYKKAKEYLGQSCWVDTSIQCGHQDKRTGRVFGIRNDFPQAQTYRDIPRKKKGLLLDIGSGEYGPHFQDYDIVRLDNDPAAEPDILADAKQLPIDDLSFDYVYASHVLEHFSFKWVKNVLKEWIRVLKIGGELQITVPNLEWAAERILKGKDGKEQLSSYDSERSMFMFFSAQKDGGAVDFHKNGFTPASLHGLLNSIDTLTDIRIETSDGIISNWDEDAVKNGNYNIIAWAKKKKHDSPVSVHKNLSIADQEEIKYMKPEDAGKDTPKVIKKKSKKPSTTKKKVKKVKGSKTKKKA